MENVCRDCGRKFLSDLRFCPHCGGDAVPPKTNGIAALCSPDGRHLAIMPHPERGFLSWQCGWNPPEWRDAIRAAADQGQPFPSPWMRMFQNAREWCEGS